MARRAQFGKKKGRKGDATAVDTVEDLGRFAGSSDEDGDEETPVKKRRESEGHMNKSEHDADIEDSESEGGKMDNEVDVSDIRTKPDQPYVTNSELGGDGEDAPGQKMAGIMAKILGSSMSGADSSSAVLAKTTTPLQRLQQKEKEKIKAMKLNREKKRERNLAALHIPLSVATSNTINDGHRTIAKELEQERFHRRVATRGVVALFNAISQHQIVTENNESLNKTKDASKMTKHGFLSKIKSTAATMDTTKQQLDIEKKGKQHDRSSENNWQALKDDFMMNPQKNWDEEEESSSMDENDGAIEQLPDELGGAIEAIEDSVTPKQKRRRGL